MTPTSRDKDLNLDQEKTHQRVIIKTVKRKTLTDIKMKNSPMLSEKDLKHLGMRCTEKTNQSKRSSKKFELK